MSVAAAFKKMRRALAFVRHMPFSKLARRVDLDLRRRLRDRLPSPARPTARPAPSRAQNPPAPLFAPRAALAPKRQGDRWSFEFLARAIGMAGPRIDWGAPAPGAAHQLWRMNLHYMEYLEGVDDDAWAALVEDWIEANPATRPSAWRDSWNSYALSLRVVVWLQELTRRGDRLPAKTRVRAAASAAKQLTFLERNLETDIGGNHLIKNIKALVWASAFFIGPEAERWRAIGLKLLEKELAAQILADGMHYERSPSYHCQVFADLLECRHALGDDPIGGALDDALCRMAQVAADLAHPDGGVALFNDAGLTMAYSPGECLDVYARLFGARPEPRRVFAFPAAGYYGLRVGENYVVADCGRIAPDDLPAHGHGDVLSFEWSAVGERIIVDQGVYEYIAGEKRAASRAAMSHNTLCLDGSDQADFFGAFRCGHRPNVETRRWEPSANGFLLEGAHDGFAHLPGRPRHVRRIQADADSIDILDRIEGRADRNAHVNFLLHPKVVVELDAGGIELRWSAVRIAFTSSSPAELVPAVWWPDMGREHPTSRIVIALAPGDTESRASFRIVSGEARA